MPIEISISTSTQCASPTPPGAILPSLRQMVRLPVVADLSGLHFASRSQGPWLSQPKALLEPASIQANFFKTCVYLDASEFDQNGCVSLESPDPIADNLLDYCFVLLTQSTLDDHHSRHPGRPCVRSMHRLG